jgi:hypothetical protein
MSADRLRAEDTSVELDTFTADGEDRGEIAIRVYDLEGRGLFIEGTPSSILMLVDRINDRVHRLRGEPDQ